MFYLKCSLQNVAQSLLLYDLYVYVSFDLKTTVLPVARLSFKFQSLTIVRYLMLFFRDKQSCLCILQYLRNVSSECKCQIQTQWRIPKKQYRNKVDRSSYHLSFWRTRWCNNLFRKIRYY